MCIDKIDEQNKETFSLMFTCGIIRDRTTKKLKGFYGLPGFMFTGTVKGVVDTKSWQKMHAEPSEPYHGHNPTQYFNAARFSTFIDFLVSQAHGKRIMWFIDSATTHLTPEIRKKLARLWAEGKLYCFFLPRNTTLIFRCWISQRIKG